MSSASAQREQQPPLDEVQIHIEFDCVIQRTPTRTKRQIFSFQKTFYVDLKLSRKHLDEKGYPDPRALWFVEQTFLKKYSEDHLPDVRLLRWKSHLSGDPFILSEYRVLLPAAMH